VKESLGVVVAFGSRYYLLAFMFMALPLALTGCDHLRFEPKPSQGHIAKPTAAADTASIPRQCVQHRHYLRRNLPKKRPPTRLL
jgi:hypothetical protein